MHYYKRNLGDYAKKAGRLSMLQHGSYTLLIDACYDREAFPTLEEAIEWTWASSAAEIEAVEFVLRKFFLLEGGVYVQKRIQEEIQAFHSKAETNKRIAMERETNRKFKGTVRARVVNEPPPEEHEPPPNQEPRTKNHKPEKEAVASLRASKKCPATFDPGPDLLTWAQSECPHVNPTAETAKLRDHTFRDARTDWPGTWRNWMRKAQEDAANRLSHQARASPTETAYQASERRKVEILTGNKRPQGQVIDAETCFLENTR